MSTNELETQLEAWMRAYENDVLRLCYVYLRDLSLAEDALQDTFLKVWRGMRRFQALRGSSPRTWIMRIAINTCKDYQRSAWFKHVDSARATDDLPPALLPVSEQQRELYLDVMALPDPCRQVIVLYYYQGMSLEETSRSLGISRPAVTRRLKKAYELLRYQPEGSEAP